MAPSATLACDRVEVVVRAEVVCYLVLLSTM